MIESQEAIDHISEPYHPKTIPFQFSGQANEYFRIWIVNILLTIVTLGIYSAWAKVRRKRYIYGCTTLDGSSFEYLAEPMKILKGRIIIFAIYLIWGAVTKYRPEASFIILIAIIAAIPWAINKSLKFNAVNSSYRNVRFNYNATYMETLITFIGFGILSALSFGLLLPYYIHRIKKHVANHSRYGMQHYQYVGSAKGMYMIYLKGAIGMALVLVGIVVASMGIGFLQKSMGPEAAIFMILPGLLVYVGAGLVMAYIQAVQTNYIFDHLQLRENRFESTLIPFKLLSIYATNYMAIALSLGLLAPWAKIRMVNYRLDNLFYKANSDLDSFVAKETEELAALGEEVSDLFDIDMGF